MHSILTKSIIAILCGFVFFFGGILGVSAQANTVTVFKFAFAHLNGTPGKSPAFPDEPSCIVEHNKASVDASLGKQAKFYSIVYMCKPEQGQLVTPTATQGATASPAQANTATATTPATAVTAGTTQNTWVYLIMPSVGASTATGSGGPFTTLPDCNKARDADPSPYKKACSVTTATSANQLQAQVKSNNTESDPLLKNFKCALLSGEINGCLPIWTYYLVYKPTAYFLMGCGYLFDKMLGLSLDESFINKNFVNTSWTIVRDFSNMLFIFVLLYTGISTMLGYEKNWFVAVKNVVVIALLINFSLFFTKVIIDAGNVLAVGINSSIQTGTLSLSESIASSFEPQKFLVVASGSPDAKDAIAVFFLAAVVSGFAGYVFLKAALLFLGRLIAFWFLMIVSPFAFISITLPKGNVFQKWLDELVRQSFVAPLYLFLIYLIMQVVNVPGGILGGAKGTKALGSWLFDGLLVPIIIAIFLIFAMQRALKLATDMSGDFGSATSKWVGMAAGLAGGGVLGGAAGAGRLATLGADRLATKAVNKGWVAQGGTVDKARQSGVAKYLKSSSFDVRNIGGKDSLIGKGVGKIFGERAGEAVGGIIAKSVSGGVGSLGINTAGSGIGGVKATDKAKADKQKAEATKVKNKAEVPMLQQQLQGLKTAYFAAQQANGDIFTTGLNPQEGDPVERQGSNLKNAINDPVAGTKPALLAADIALKGNPRSRVLQAAYIQALARNDAAEKALKNYESGEDNIDKLEKKIEAYKNL